MLAKILFVIFILVLIFGKWTGIPLSKFCVWLGSNPYGAILIVFALILALISIFHMLRRLFFFSGK